MKKITDPEFRYVKAVDTNLRKTFARERARLKALAEKQQQADAEAQVKTLKFKAKP